MVLGCFRGCIQQGGWEGISKFLIPPPPQHWFLGLRSTRRFPHGFFFRGRKAAAKPTPPAATRCNQLQANVPTMPRENMIHGTSNRLLYLWINLEHQKIANARRFLFSCSSSQKLMFQVLPQALFLLSFGGSVTPKMWFFHYGSITSRGFIVSNHEPKRHPQSTRGRHEPSINILNTMKTTNHLVGGWPTPLKNMKASWDYNSQYMET